jgi:cbb3-type cytochrome oxidase subunit 3
MEFDLVFAAIFYLMALFVMLVLGWYIADHRAEKKHKAISESASIAIWNCLIYEQYLEIKGIQKPQGLKER